MKFAIIETLRFVAMCLVALLGSKVILTLIGWVIFNATFSGAWTHPATGVGAIIGAFLLIAFAGLMDEDA